MAKKRAKPFSGFVGVFDVARATLNLAILSWVLKTKQPWKGILDRILHGSF